MWLWFKRKKTMPSFSLTGNEKTHMRNPCEQNPPRASKSAGFSIATDNSDSWKQRPSYVITWLSYVQDEQGREKSVLTQHLSLSVLPRMPSFYAQETENFFPVYLSYADFYFIPLMKIIYQVVACVSIFTSNSRWRRNVVVKRVAPSSGQLRELQKALSYFCIKIHKINQCPRYVGM